MKNRRIGVKFKGGEHLKRDAEVGFIQPTVSIRPPEDIAHLDVP
jgi:hypothetical protein